MVDNIQEEWKDIEGYEGLYMISNLGRVKSLRHGKWIERRSNVNRQGYYALTLHKDGGNKTCTIHRLVAKAFIPNPLGFPCVNHKDENKENNRVDNLEWCTYVYNNNYGTAKNEQQKLYQNLL